MAADLTSARAAHDAQQMPANARPAIISSPIGGRFDGPASLTLMDAKVTFARTTLELNCRQDCDENEASSIGPSHADRRPRSVDACGWFKRSCPFSEPGPSTVVDETSLESKARWQTARRWHAQSRPRVTGDPAASFDKLVGAAEESRRKHDVVRPGRLEMTATS